jgi:hypothetical protein
MYGHRFTLSQVGNPPEIHKRELKFGRRDKIKVRGCSANEIELVVACSESSVTKINFLRNILAPERLYLYEGEV